MPDPRADWPAIAGDVARALLGEPSSATGRELRYGTRGSLAVHVGGERAGTWRDFEAGEGGGVLDLVRRERRCDTAAALDWLESCGFIEAKGPGRPAGPGNGPESRSEPFSGSAGIRGAGEAPSTAPAGSRGASRRDSAPGSADSGPPDARTALARRLWELAEAPDTDAGRVYLARRFAWPPLGIGPELPATVRWLALERASFEDRAAKWYGLPREAAGALAFAWRLPGETDPATAPAAVSLLAVSKAGERVTWFGERAVRVRTCGSRIGAVFVARRGLVSGPIDVAEGEIDALALCLAPWCGPGAVLAVGGTSGMRRAATLGSGPVVLHCDGDPAGRGAVEHSRHAIEATGRPCRVEWYPVGTDAADALADWLRERAAVREVEGGEARADAERGAWMDLRRRGRES